MKRDHFLEIMRCPRSVLTTHEVSLLWGVRDMPFVRKKLHRYVKAGELYPVRKGIYAKDRRYDRFELATRIFTPAYVSLETVLAQAGMIFQFQKRILVLSYLSREVKVDGQVYVFRKIRDSILTNHTGMDIRGCCPIASPERAFLDLLYLGRNYEAGYFSDIDWDKVADILPIYGGHRRMEREVELLRQHLG